MKDASVANDTTSANAASAYGAVPDALTLADGRRVPLHGDEVRIGRASMNDIVVEDELVAEQHAWLRRLPDGWLLADLTHGSTAVNGQRLTQPVVLAPGDRVRLGRLVATFVPADGRGAAAAAGSAGRARRPDTPLVEVRRVVKTYPSSAGPVPVLRGVDLTVEPGEFVAIVGPSGCGKTTLLNVITGIDRPDAGEVVVGGQAVHRLPADVLAGWRGRAVGIVFQFFQLLPTLTVAENVMLPMAFCRTYPGPQRRARALAVLRRVGLEALADRLPSALSGGEQQRVAIARALANEPALLVADEPTGNLDRETGRQIVALFADLAAGGTTVLMVTHDPALARYAVRQIAMADGQIVETP